VIVADSNLLAYLMLGGPEAEDADRVFRRDPEWAVPLLWRSEFRSILAGYMRQRGLRVADAAAVHELTERLLAGREYSVRGDAVLQLVAESSCSAYDCEYVALARELQVPLVTWDRQVLRAFPAVAVAGPAFAGGSA
jgi:predicted nucleic acid-binding protein